MEVGLACVAELLDEGGLPFFVALWLEVALLQAPVLGADVQWILGQDARHAVFFYPCFAEALLCENSSGESGSLSVEDPDAFGRI
jgi:hypothetical protein